VEKLEKNQIEIVRKMKAKSYPIEEISEITGMSIEEINKI
jgi:predicted transposase YdaD